MIDVETVGCRNESILYVSMELRSWSTRVRLILGVNFQQAERWRSEAAVMVMMPKLPISRTE